MSKFSSIIEQIMPDVVDGSTKPFIIYRDKGGWQCERKMPLASARKIDLLATRYSGTDFSRGSYAYVYEKVLCERLRAEHVTDKHADLERSAETALLNFMDENACALSDGALDYIADSDNPYYTLLESCRLDMATDDEDCYFNEELIDEAIREIESNIAERIECERYADICAIRLDGTKIALAEDKREGTPFAVYDSVRKPFGGENVRATFSDFISAYKEFASRVAQRIDFIEKRREECGVSSTALTSEDCITGGLDSDITGKLIIIKPTTFSPEYRTADNQLQIATGGFGTAPNSRGNAIFCKSLCDGTECRHEKYNVLGVANPDRLPEWAREKLAERLKNSDKKASITDKIKAAQKDVVPGAAKTNKNKEAR